VKRTIARALLVCAFASMGSVGCEGLLGVDGLQIATDAGSSGGGDDAGDSAPPATFAGNWTCTGTTSLRFTKPPTQPPQSDTGTATYVVAETSPTELTITGRTDAGACAKRYTRAGTTASLEGGQSCTSVDGTTALTNTFTNGSAILDGDKLMTTLSWDFTGTVMSGGQQVPIQGSGSSDGRCTRL